jgi:dTDP-4-amino-4,6-dideoxygalactose transaminase
MRRELEEVIGGVLDSGQFILGGNVAALEEEIAKFCGAKYGIGVASGSDALTLSLLALDIGPGDEVITSPFTFVATAGSIALLGAKVVFADIDPLTYNIDPEKIEQLITENTKAIVPVHLYGQPAEMDSILEIADDHGLRVIEDAAQAIGAEYKGRKACSLGDVAALSFFPTKNLGAFGDAGMVLTNDDAIYEKVHMLRVHGSCKKYEHIALGYNSRLDELQAAILRVKLKYLDRFTDMRRNIANTYNSLLKDYVVTPHESPNVKHVYHQYTIRTQERDELKRNLARLGISSTVYYPIPLHLQKALRFLGYREGDFHETERASREVLSLPMFPELQESEIRMIADAIRECL